MEKLWRAYKFDSDLQAKEELIRQCLPLVKSTAHRLYMYASPSHDIDDLSSAGIMGLLDAIDKYLDKINLIIFSEQLNHFFNIRD